MLNNKLKREPVEAVSNDSSPFTNFKENMTGLEQSGASWPIAKTIPTKRTQKPEIQLHWVCQLKKTHVMHLLRYIN